jgi:S-adenosylmethionine:tRNA ribosyltransferase-isomerase
MHSERITVSEEAAQIVNRARGRIVAVGTTSCRTLESAAVAPRRIAPLDGETNLYITPGYRFRTVDALLTNFHMPRSTLLVLVSAFAGQELIRRAYAEALATSYRFLSFGDTMLLS